MLYIYSGCSFRGVTKVLEIINLVLFRLPGSIPSHTMVKNWVEKCGLDVYQNNGKSLCEAYSLIIDESVAVAGEKILVQLKAPSQHPQHPLKRSDFKVVGIDVANSWTGDDVQKALAKTTNEIGRIPDYVTSDHGPNLSKAIRNANIPHHLDISHTFGTFLERVYKEDDEFKTFTKRMSETRKYALTDVAYLTPPNQRSLARFMNMFDWVKWSKKMLDNFHTFSIKERMLYSFIPTHASFIEELSDIMLAYEQILTICKSRGLSNETVIKSNDVVVRNLMIGGLRMQKIGQCILDYLRKEMAIVKNSEVTHNVSSDAIETVFGFYKERKSPNKLFGVTSFILTIPLYSKLADLNSIDEFDVKSSMRTIKLRDVKRWAKNNLHQNLVAKKIKRLA